MSFIIIVSICILVDGVPRTYAVQLERVPIFEMEQLTGERCVYGDPNDSS